MRFNTLAAVILLISGCGYGGLELESFPEVSQKPAKEAKLKPESPQRKRPDRDDQVSFGVEIVGVEPTTPCLQSRCSSQLSYTPLKRVQRW